MSSAENLYFHLGSEWFIMMYYMFLDSNQDFMGHEPNTFFSYQQSVAASTCMLCINLTVSVCFCFSMSMDKRVC